MAEVKFIKTTSDVMPEIVDGQFIAVHDTGEIYLDTGEERKKYGSSVKMYFDTDANILATDSTDTEALYYATDTGRIYRRMYVQDAPDGSGPYYIWLNVNGVNALTVEEGTKYGKKWDITGLVKIAKAFQTGAGMWFSGGAVLGEAALLNVYDPNLGDPGTDSTFRSFYPTTAIDTMVGECVKNADIYTTSKIHIGSEASATGGGSVAIGRETNASGSQSIAIGAFAESTAKYAIQLGEGVNSTEKSLAVGYGETDDEGNPISYPLLVGGLIPEERIPDTIARTSAIPDVTTFLTQNSADLRYQKLWNSQTISITEVTSATLIDNHERFYATALTTLTVTTGTFTGKCVFHFLSGETATAYSTENGNYYHVGYHCYAGIFTPQKNTKYTLIYTWDGTNIVCNVGGYAYSGS